MRKQSIFPAIAIAVLGTLLLGGIYLHRGGAPQCMYSGYQHFAWSYDGAKRTGRQLDGSPEMFIQGALLVPGGMRAETAFRRGETLVECRADLENADRIAYVELRSSELDAAVQAWRAGQNHVTGFREGPLKRWEQGDVRDRDKRFWSPGYVFAQAPQWFSREQINEASFVAFWGGGHLFQGKRPDEYYWVGYLD